MRRLFALLILVVGGPFTFADDVEKKEKPTTPLAEARQRWLRGNYAEARELFEKQANDKKGNVPAILGIAQTWLSEGEAGKALQVVEEGLKTAEDAPDLQALKADLLYRAGKWDEAFALCETIIKAKAEHFQARWVRAQIYRDRGDFDNADKEMRWFVRTYTQRDNDDKPIQNPDELLLVGQAGSENARWHSLGDQFRFIISDIYPDALKFDANLWQAEYQIGMLLLEKYNRPEAMQAFDNALKINPKAAEAMVGKGLVALQQYEIKDAETHVDQALKVNPSLTVALRLKADVQLMAGELSEARKTLLKAKQVQPREEATLARLAACAILMKTPDELPALIQEVEAFNKKPGIFYGDLAHLLEDRKVYGEAERYFKLAIELRGKFPGPRGGLGMLYLRLGKEVEAKDLLSKAFDDDRFNVRVSNSLKVLRHLEKYETLKTAHYDLRYDPKTDPLLAVYLGDYLEETHAQLAKDFGFEPEGRILIELFNNHEMFSGRTIGLPDLHTIGACTGKVVTMVSPKGKGVPKLFNWGRVIRHELVHIFNLAQTDFLVPHWLTEGLAVRKEGGNRPPAWSAVLRERFDKDDLLNLDNILLAFVRPRSQAEWSLAYCQSHLYVEYVIKTYGIEAIGKLLNVYRTGVDTGTAIQKVCGIDKAAFEKGYKGYVTEVVKAIPSAGRRVVDKPMTLAELEKAHEKTPDDADISARLADQYLRRKRPGDARKLVDQVLEKDENHTLASIVKAKLLVAAGDEEAAQKLLQKAAKTTPDDPRMLTVLGRMALEAKQYQKAAEFLEKGRKIAPLDGDWLTQLEELYTKTEETEKRIDVLKEMVGNDPDDLEIRLNLAKLWIDQKKYAEAETVARDATYIDVTNETAQKLLLESLTKQNKEEAAQKLRDQFQKGKPKTD